MVDSTVFSSCGSVGLLLRSEAALVAALICEVALERGLDSEAGIMMAMGEDVDVGETGEDG
jgi:acid phosphatase family membrane protein YuiD